MEGEHEDCTTDEFLKEVKDRAKALSKNATQDTPGWLESERNMDMEGDEETQTYLTKIRNVAPFEQVTIQIGSFDHETKGRNEDLDFASSSVSHSPLDFEAQRFKVSLAHRGVQKRKKPVTKRWSYAAGDEVFFEIKASPRNDDTLMEEDDDGKEEDAPEVQFSKKARISLHGASAMSPNLMANLSQALKRSRPGDRKEVDLPTRPKSMMVLGEEEQSDSPSSGAFKILLPGQIQLKKTGLREQPSLYSLSPETIRATPFLRPKEMQSPPVMPKVKKEFSVDSPSQSPPVPKYTLPHVPLKHATSRSYSIESPMSSSPGSPSLSVQQPKPLQESQDSESSHSSDSRVLPSRIDVSFTAGISPNIKASASPPVAPKVKLGGGKPIASSAALVKAAAIAKKSEVAKEEKYEPEEPKKPAWLQELDRKKQTKVKMNTPERSKTVSTIEPEWVAKVQKRNVTQEGNDARMDIERTDSQMSAEYQPEGEKTIDIEVKLESGLDVSKSANVSVENVSRPSIPKDATEEVSQKEEAPQKPGWMQELDENKEAKARLNKTGRPKNIFQPDLSANEPDWFGRVKKQEIRREMTEVDHSVPSFEQAKVQMGSSQDEKAVAGSTEVESVKPEGSIVKVEWCPKEKSELRGDEKVVDVPKKPDWLEELDKKRPHRAKRSAGKPRPKSMFEPSTASSEPEWIVKVKKREAMRKTESIEEPMVVGMVETDIACKTPTKDSFDFSNPSTVDDTVIPSHIQDADSFGLGTNMAKTDLTQALAAESPGLDHKNEAEVTKKLPQWAMKARQRSEEYQRLADEYHVKRSESVETETKRDTVIDLDRSSEPSGPDKPSGRRQGHSLVKEAEEAQRKLKQDYSDKTVLDKEIRELSGFPDPVIDENESISQPASEIRKPKQKVVLESKGDESAKLLSDQEISIQIPRPGSSEREKIMPVVEPDSAVTKSGKPEKHVSKEFMTDRHKTAGLPIPPKLDRKQEAITEELPEWAMKARQKSDEYQRLAREYQAVQAETKRVIATTSLDGLSESSSPDKPSGRRRRSSLVKEAEEARRRLKQEYHDKAVLDKEIRELAGFSDTVIDQNTNVSQPASEISKPRQQTHSESKEATKSPTNRNTYSEGNHQVVNPNKMKPDADGSSVATSPTREELPKALRGKLVRVNSFERERPAKIEIRRSPEEVKTEKRAISSKDSNLKGEHEEATDNPSKHKKKVLKIKLRSKKSLDGSITRTEQNKDEISNRNSKDSTELTWQKEDLSPSKVTGNDVKFPKKVDSPLYSKKPGKVQSPVPTNVKENYNKKNCDMDTILNSRNKSNSGIGGKLQRPSSLFIEDAAYLKSNGSINSDTGKSNRPGSMILSESDDLRSMDTYPQHDSLKSPEEANNLVSPTQDKTAWMKNIFERKSNQDKSSTALPEWKRKLLARRKEGHLPSSVQDAPHKPEVPAKPTNRDRTSSESNIAIVNTYSNTNKSALTRTFSDARKPLLVQISKRPSGGSAAAIDQSDFRNDQDKEFRPPSFLKEFNSKKEARMIKKAHTAPTPRRSSMGKDEPEWLQKRKSIIKDLISEPTSEEWV